MATKKTKTATTTETTVTTEAVETIATVDTTTAKLETAESINEVVGTAKLGASTTATSINELSRMDLGLQRQFGGLKSQAMSGTSIILPTTDAENFDVFYCVDTKDFYMFYSGTWYKQN